MSELTFQKLYKITIGQYTSEGGITPLVGLDEYRFSSRITKSARSSTAKVPPVTQVNVYNILPEIISKLSTAINLYIEIRAGYLFDGESMITKEDLPIVYLGSIFFTSTIRNSVDIITTFSCTDFSDRISKGKANKQFTAGASVRSVFDYLAETIQMPIRHDWVKKGSLILPKDRTVEGSTMTVFHKWCERYDLRLVSDKGVIKIIDKAVSHTSKLRHNIPLSRMKNYPNISMDLSKSLREKSTPTPEVNLDTFLYPIVSLNDSISVELIDYESPQVVGEYKTVNQEFIVNSYVHDLDSHDNSKWTTSITAKGSQR